MSLFQNCSSQREEALKCVWFEPRYLGCYGVLKLPQMMKNIFHLPSFCPLVHGKTQPRFSRGTQHDLPGGNPQLLECRAHVENRDALKLCKRKQVLVTRHNGVGSCRHGAG